MSEFFAEAMYEEKKNNSLLSIPRYKSVQPSVDPFIIYSRLRIYSTKKKQNCRISSENMNYCFVNVESPWEKKKKRKKDKTGWKNMSDASKVTPHFFFWQSLRGGEISHNRDVSASSMFLRDYNPRGSPFYKAKSWRMDFAVYLL